jgi:small-conductance mechanosensitive channel
LHCYRLSTDDHQGKADCGRQAGAEGNGEGVIMNWDSLRDRSIAWNDSLQAYVLDDYPAMRWGIALVVFLAALLFIYICKWVAHRRLARLAERTSSGWDDAVVEAIQRTRWWLMAALALYLASRVLIPTPPAGEPAAPVDHLLRTIAVLAFIVQFALWGNLVIDRGLQRYADRKLKGDPASLLTITALVFIGRLILFTLLLLLALSNIGINVSALITGLGIGGIAVALAVQNILGDLLASMSIVFDKPFVPGDFIIVGDQMGTVQHIGLKTTRLTSLSGEQLIFSNADLLQSRIRNFKRMNERRAIFTIGVTYQTPPESLQQIPGILRDAIEAQAKTRFDRAHFKEFGPSSLNFEAVYFVLAPEMSVYLDIQQAINFTLLKQFASLNIDFAYPTQTVYVQQTGQQPTRAVYDVSSKAP